MTKRQIASIVGVLAIALVASGCGDDSSANESKEVSTASISKAEFIKKGNAVCKKTNQRIQVAFQAYLKSLNGVEPEGAARTAAMEHVANQIIKPAKLAEAEELRAVGAPTSDAKAIQAIANALEEGVKKAEREPERAVRDGTEAYGKSSRLAEEYGLLSTC